MNENWTTGCRKFARVAIALCLLLAIVGCSGGKGGGIVNGKVTFKDKPVKGGILTFTPVAAEGATEGGKAAQTKVGDDGSFAATGVMVGKCTVSYSAPEITTLPDGSLPTTKNPAPQSEYAGLMPKTKEVEIKSGPNTVDVELIPGFPKRKKEKDS